MPLLDHYLRAVRLYLPKGPQQDDIIEEIAGNLTAAIEEEESRLGRPLTEVEEEALLTRHGGPIVVAERYGVAQRGLAFGRQLISPETFPLYARVLTFQIPVTLAVLIFIGLTNESRLLTPTGLLWPLLIQFCLTTGVFIMMVAGFLQAYPYVTVMPGTSVAHASRVAVGLSDGIWWHSGFTFGLYSLSCLIFNLILCVQFARRRARRRLELPA